MAKLQPVKKIIEDVEYRNDLLSGDQVRINPARAKRPKQAQGDTTLFTTIINKSKENCVFCPERILEKVPQFNHVTLKGRIIKGDTIMFPNMNPFGQNHAVAVFAKDHFLETGSFSPLILHDCILAAVEYFHKMHQDINTAKYPVFVWNYMPPSAGSIIHPHTQLLIEDQPVPALAKLIHASEEYHKKNGETYWNHLIHSEQALNERWIGTEGTGADSVHVFATFAPRGNNEVAFLFPAISSLGQLTPALASNFVSALTKILTGYKELGVASFNLVSFSAPLEGTSHWALQFHIFSRPPPYGIYTADTGPMERVYDVWVIDTLPELLAQQLRPLFEAKK